jgi:hypothetical protein
MSGKGKFSKLDYASLTIANQDEYPEWLRKNCQNPRIHNEIRPALVAISCIASESLSDRGGCKVNILLESVISHDSGVERLLETCFLSLSIISLDNKEIYWYIKYGSKPKAR